MDTTRLLLLFCFCFCEVVLQRTESKKDRSSLNETRGRNVFRCRDILPPSPTVPTSVHSLRPGDVKVVAALGDSLTAGTGVTAKTIVQELTPNRGLSWSGGGQGTLEEHLTMPNILKQYNPQLYGYATGDGSEDSRRAHFNLAVVGADSGNLEQQARRLVQRLKADPRVDFLSDWKLVTILIGNNDLCRHCNKPDLYNEAQFYQNLVRGLDVLHGELPRTLVSLVEPLDMQQLSRLHKGLLCAGVHLMVCECASFPKSKAAVRRLAEVTHQYQRTVRLLAASGRYDTRHDFTLVHQPLFSHTTLPLKEDHHIDMSYFAPDCFHLSSRGQEAAALALWNSMVSPLQDKDTQWSSQQSPRCPSLAQPYLYTNYNSRPEGTPEPSSSRQGQVSVQVLTAVTVIGMVISLLASVLFIAVCRRLKQRQLYVQMSQ